MSIVEQNKIIRSGIGPRACDRNRAFPGFTLFAPLSGNGTVYLIDLDGEVGRSHLADAVSSRAVRISHKSWRVFI